MSLFPIIPNLFVMKEYHGTLLHIAHMMFDMVDSV